MRPFLLAVLLFVPSSVQAQEKLYRISEAVAIVGHSADLAATQRCLGAGTCRELNPWLGRFDGPVQFSIAKMGVASLGLWATSKIPNKKIAAVVNFGIGSAYLALGVRNARIGR